MFLLSLLGEIICVDGEYTAPRTPVAYASQQPLIVAATIRDNILFGREYSAGWYDAVLEACSLTREIHQLDAKDGTFVDEKGLTLSGGQRQRISLARAVYAKAAWTLLDDSFSALDAQTEEHVFRSLFGTTGIMRNQSVILVTHNVRHLRHADTVLVLDSGKIQYHGTLENIKAAGYSVENEMGDAQKNAEIAKLEVKDSSANSEEAENTGNNERDESAIQASSLGFTPYMFYMRMAGLWGSVAVIVNIFGPWYQPTIESTSGASLTVRFNEPGLAANERISSLNYSLGLALANIISISGYISDLLMSLSGLENSAVSISRIHEIATLPEEKDSVSPPVDAKLLVPMTPRGSLTFKNVGMRYRSDLPPAVNDVSFNVSTGQKIGICGRSGSGKSSLLVPLFRGVESSLVTGKIMMDEVDVQTIPLGTLRNSLSFVAQRPFIWYASVRDNIDPEGSHTDEQLWTALERVGMHRAISELPDRLETLLEDEGSLSSGQRQLLCLVRALLRQTSIVILDEASSSLDGETEKRVREIINSDFKDRTVISIAHRIETIIDFDLIFVMEDALLVEIGDPRDLLSHPESRFARLAASQGLEISVRD
ncbi:hypothetical protein MVEN_01456300 [Mycena venus]|uniref:ABC transporter domain-containing protein n=1 Tax=Mycena venus TaxID=2733690 RepID=A0A8H6XS37_9AGAR|nr:hypothetical protein MVEN_01456300 [Mycena venus]